MNPFYLGIIIFGLGIFTKYFTGSIPGLLGYHSFLSMKNSELWKISNSIMGNILILLGLISTILSFFFSLKTILLFTLSTFVISGILLEFYLFKKYTSS